MTNIEDIKTNDLASETDVGSGRVTVRLIGSAESDAMHSLSAYLRSVHAAAKGAGDVEEVAVDFRRLEFMNSSCFKAFVSWIDSLQESAAAEQYRVRFLSDPAKHWQSRSLNALACFASDDRGLTRGGGPRGAPRSLSQPRDAAAGAHRRGMGLVVRLLADRHGSRFALVQLSGPTHDASATRGLTFTGPDCVGELLRLSQSPSG